MLSGLLPSARFDADHDTFRETVRRFVDKAVLPHIDAWEEAETFPRALYREAADLGLLGIGFPEEYGGTPGDSHRCAAIRAVRRPSWRAERPS